MKRKERPGSEVSGETAFRVSLDRMEEELAVLITMEGHQFTIPAALLPESASEGDVIDVLMRRNLEETEALGDRVRDLQRRLLERTAGREKAEDL
jgi:hypothetical protein